MKRVELEQMSHGDLVNEVIRLQNNTVQNTTTIEAVMTDVRGNISEGARLLKVNRSTLKGYIDKKTVNRVAILEDGTLQALTPPSKTTNKKG